MKPTVTTPWQFEHSFEHDLAGLFVPWQAAEAPQPGFVAFNTQVAKQLGATDDDLAFWHSPDGLAILVGNAVPEGAVPIAQGYAGHQFGGYSPRLGDGRALLIGEVIDPHGARWDVHLKGSGRTPFARGGDGNAAIGPMLREFIISEALHALDIPTTRALSVAVTGKAVQRDTPLPGAVLARVASSHLRVGSFQYAANLDDETILRRLAEYAIQRHYPDAADTENPYLSLLERVIEVQAQLVARWMLVGFIHGVMNTDNVTISGESIDFGPCAFMDVYDPATVFSSIDHGGRYAYGNQPSITQWNLARFAEALLALIDDDTDVAVELATNALRKFAPRFQEIWSLGMQAKLGIVPGQLTDEQLIDDYLELLMAQRVDYTNSFRALAAWLRGDASAIGTWFSHPAAFDAWAERWTTQLTPDHAAVADAMDHVNPLYIARNHLVEEALAAATTGDSAPLEQLCSVLANPYTARPGLERYALPAPDAFGPYQTFCGT